MDLELAERSLVVTGATRGIGLAIAHRLVAEGAHVTICGRDPAGVAAATAALDGPGRVHGVALDVTAAGAGERLVDAAVEAFGRLDGVVANAGGAVGDPRLAATGDDDWTATLHWNVVASADLVRAATPALAASELGCAVLVGSVSAARQGPWPQYAAAKAALESMARSLAGELAPQRIRVVCVRPGSIRFPGGAWERYAEAEPEGYAAFVAADLPWERLGRPEEVADVVAFLLSPRARWINGAVVPVDGAQRGPSPYPTGDHHDHPPREADVLKVIGTAYRREDVAPEEFVRYWLEEHGPLSARTPGLRGYVVSEVLSRALGELEADAFVEQWWDDEAAYEASRSTPEVAAAWADVERFATMDGTFWLTTEHVLKTPVYDDAGLLEGGRGQREGRVKAIGTAYRREDFSTRAFFDYWRDVHAPISARAPGLGAYVVSEVLRRTRGELEADAFVEQWWDDEATLATAGDSPEVAVAWADVANYARTDGTFWVCREHVLLAPTYDGPGLLER